MGPGVSVDRDGGPLEEVKAAHFVNSAHMVGMRVRAEDGVDVFNPVLKGLLTKVGRHVDEEALLVDLDPNGRS